MGSPSTHSSTFRVFEPYRLIVWKAMHYCLTTGAIFSESSQVVVPSSKDFTEDSNSTIELDSNRHRSRVNNFD